MGEHPPPGQPEPQASRHEPPPRNNGSPDTHPTTEKPRNTPVRPPEQAHRPTPQTPQSNSSPATLRSSHSPHPKAGISVPKQQDQAPSQPRCSLKPGGQAPLQGPLDAGPAGDHQPQSSSPARHQICSNNPSRAPLRRTWSTTSRPPARALTSSSLAVINVSPSNGSGPHKPLNTLYSELSASARRSDESAPLNLSGSRRTSTAIRAARPLSSSGYFLDTLMTPILLCIHRLHQTRDDTGSHTATSSTPPPSPAASPSSRTPSSAWPRTRPTSARLTQIPSIPPDAHKGVRVRQAS